MPAWLIPALKAALPHIGTIISAAAPVFTRKADAANQTLLLQQQITELQSAASQNAAHIKELAAELQSTVAALEQAASIAEAKLRRAILLCVASAVLSAISVGIALVLVFGR
jgi:ABC-type enterochelin transport system substrate-binding protein